MAEVNIRLFQAEYLNGADVKAGTATPKRHARCHVVYKSSGSTDTLDLNKSMGSGVVADIVGVEYSTMNDATPTATGSAITWTSAIAVTASHAGDGEGEAGFLVSLT